MENEVYVVHDLIYIYLNVPQYDTALSSLTLFSCLKYRFIHLYSTFVLSFYIDVVFTFYVVFIYCIYINAINGIWSFGNSL